MRFLVSSSEVVSRAAWRYFMIFISSSTRSFFEGTAAFPASYLLDAKAAELFSSIILAETSRAKTAID
jgi:hypothetical protein